MELGVIVSWAGALLKLLPKVAVLLRRAHKLTITGTNAELGMMVISVVIGGLVGLGVWVWKDALWSFFVAPSVAIVLYVILVKLKQAKEPVYHAEGYLTVEGREGVFCPKCWEEKKKLIPMRYVENVIVAPMGSQKLKRYICKMCGHMVSVK
ncbi:hypothetical protein [Hydrogenivirga sp.]